MYEDIYTRFPVGTEGLEDLVVDFKQTLATLPNLSNTLHKVTG